MENKLTKPLVVCVLALICTMLWGSAFPCVKLGYQLFEIGGKDTGSQMLFAGYRFTLAGIITLVISSIGQKKLAIPKREIWVQVVVLGLIQTTLQYIFFYIGMSNTTGIKGSILTASNSFFSIVLAHFLIKGERMTLRKTLGCILGFSGVVIVNFTANGFAGGFAVNGEGFILLACLSYAIGAVYVKFFAYKDNAITITAYQLLIGGIVLMLFGKVMGGSVSTFTMKGSLLLLYMALISAIAFSVWTLLLKYNQVGKVSIYGFANPVFGVVLSAIVLGEQAFTIRNFLALVCVCMGILVVNYQRSV